MIFEPPTHFALPPNPPHPERAVPLGRLVNDLAVKLHEASNEYGAKLAEEVRLMYGVSDARVVLTLLADAHANALLAIFSQQLLRADTDGESMVLDLTQMMLEKFRLMNAERRNRLREEAATAVKN